MAKQGLAAAMAAVMWVSACGGGGGTGSPQPAPSPPSPPPPNQAPVSVAGEDINAHIKPGGTPLDGSQSSDPDGDALMFQWTIVSQPDGADAQFDDASLVQPRLQALAPGDYEIELAVTDAEGASGYDTVLVRLENDAPVPVAEASLSLPAIGENVELTAVETADPNGQPLTYTWTLETAPAGAMAGATYEGVTQTISFEEEGEYSFSLTVSDGYETVVLDLPVIFASKFSIRKLPGTFGARALQPGGGRLVVNIRSQIAVFDEGVIEPKLIPAPHDVTGVSVSPDGRIAAVEGDGAMSFVDLDKGEITATWPIDVSPQHFVVSDEGFAYITSLSDGSTDLVSVNMTTGQITKTPGRYPGLRGYLHPSGDKLYVMAGLSPNVLGRYTVSGGTLSDYRESATSNGLCGSGWVKGDGSAMMAYCGRIMQLSDDPATDMTPIGWIYNLPGVQSATYSPITKYWYVLGPPNEEYQSKIQVYDSRNYELIHTFDLPLENGSSGNQLVARYITAGETDLSLRILATDHPTADVDHYMLVTALDYPAGANLPPEVFVQKYSATYAGHAVAIDAGAASDPEGLPLAYRWRVVDEPSPDWATLDGADTAVVRMMPAMEGEYTLEVTVSDGVNEVVRQVEVYVTPGRDVVHYRLPGDILDAKYSKSLSTLAYVVDGESSVHLVNLLDFAEKLVPMERQVHRIGLSPDGRKLAASLSGRVNLVDVETAELDDTVGLSWDWGDIILDRNGHAHTNTNRGDTGPLVSIDFEADTVGTYYSIPLNTTFRAHPLMDWIIGATSRGESHDLIKWDVSSLPALPIWTKPAGTPENKFGGNIWLSEDGGQLLSAKGGLYTTSDDPLKDGVIDLVLPGGLTIGWADHSSEAGQWAVVVDRSMVSPGPDGKIVFYDDETMEQEAVLEARDMLFDGVLRNIEPVRFFYSDDGKGQVILTTAGIGSVDPFIVQVSNLPQE